MEDLQNCTQLGYKHSLKYKKGIIFILIKRNMFIG